MALAREQIAPTEYAAYMSAANEASVIVEHVTGVPVEAPKVEPRLPAQQ